MGPVGPRPPRRDLVGLDRFGLGALRHAPPGGHPPPSRDARGNRTPPAVGPRPPRRPGSAGRHRPLAGRFQPELGPEPRRRPEPEHRHRLPGRMAGQPAQRDRDGRDRHRHRHRRELNRRQRARDDQARHGHHSIDPTGTGTGTGTGTATGHGPDLDRQRRLRCHRTAGRRTPGAGSERHHPNSTSHGVDRRCGPESVHRNAPPAGFLVAGMAVPPRQHPSGHPAAGRHAGHDRDAAAFRSAATFRAVRSRISISPATFRAVAAAHF